MLQDAHSDPLPYDLHCLPATGAALGVQLLGLPWTVVGVMLAGDER